MAKAQSDIDLQWFRRHLLQDILPTWLRLASTPQGLFRVHFDRQWRWRGEYFGTLVSQSRLLYNFARGYAHTGDPAYRQAVQAGAEFMLQHFRDSEFGGWFYAVDAGGSIRDAKKDSYGHAFVIFGMAHAHAATGDARFLQAALDTWEMFRQHFFDAEGGVYLTMTRDFRDTSEYKSQNPLMHLFEALLALTQRPGQAKFRQEAEKVANFVLQHLRRPGAGFLPEVYDSAWRDLPEAQGGRIDIGHAFEWAFLLAKAAEMGAPQTYLRAAEQFIDYGLRLGHDEQDGGIISPVAPDGSPREKRKDWWVQCEATRTMLHFAYEKGRRDLLPPLRRTITFFRKHLIDAEHGGWFFSTGPLPGSHYRDKGSEWKVDYHVVGMCDEATRLLENHPEMS